MNNRILYLHIGLEKTGTTSIQKVCSELFVDEAGELVYPGGRAGLAHYELFRECQDGNATHDDGLLGELLRSPASKLFVSAEHFSFQEDFRAIESIRTACVVRGVELVIITVVREPFSYLRSVYREAVKWGEVLDFDDFVREHLWRLDIQRYAQFANETATNSIFVAYQPDPKKNIEAVIQCALPGWSLVGEPAQENRSLRTGETALYRTANRLFGNVEITRDLIEQVERRVHRQVGIDASQIYDEKISLEIARGIHERTVNDVVLRMLFVDGERSVRFGPDCEVA